MAETARLLETARAAIASERDLAEKFTDVVGDFAVDLVIALVIVAVTWVAARQAAHWVERLLTRFRGTREDRTLQLFLSQLARWLVIIVGLIAVLRRLGVEATSIIAVLGAASLAIGLALQGALSNVAAGVLLLILRPYKVGDFVEVAGKLGTVQRLDLFTTEIATPDNLKVVVPNAKVLGDVLVNQTAQPTRRIELFFDVHYDSRLEAALQVLRDTAADDDRVLPDPAPWAAVSSFKDSSILVVLHCWVKTPDWWQTRADLMLAVKNAFDRAGVIIPYPHQVQIEGPMRAEKAA